MVPEISVEALAARIDQADRPFLVDVREGEELDICALAFDLHIPLGSLPTRASEIPQDREVVIYCRSGGRSGQATAFLLSQGWTTVSNLEGGVLAWGQRVDPSMPAY
jgi:rhodanese-related sulfurtransferase